MADLPLIPSILPGGSAAPLLPRTPPPPYPSRAGVKR